MSSISRYVLGDIGLRSRALGFDDSADSRLNSELAAGI